MAVKLPSRKEIPQELTWNLESIYPSHEAWEADFKLVQDLLIKLQTFEGRLTQNGHILKEALDLRDQADSLAAKLSAYASMRLDQDTTDSFYQGLASRAETLANNASVETAFIPTELLAASPKRIAALLKRYKVLRVYKQYLADLEEERENYLSADEEELLAEAEEIAEIPSGIYRMLNDADMKFPNVADSNGEMHQLTVGNSDVLMGSRDPVLRRNAFLATTGGYYDLRHTLATCYGAQIKKEMFFAKARGYESTLAASLECIAVPVSVYTNLISTVNKNLPTLHRYLQLYRAALKKPDFHTYDLGTPLVDTSNGQAYHISYVDAQETVLAALAPLGKDYVSALKEGYANRWVDPMPNEGKHAGAYSMAVYGVAPFMLLNWHDRMDDLFTLAHESGHSMHSYLTAKRQPYIYSTYTTFLAEIASIFNEMMLAHHLLKNAGDDQMRLLVICQILELFRTTLFQQTLYAEFEKESHARAEAGKTLTAEWLSNCFSRLRKKHYGPVCAVDKQASMTWAWVPHFYDSFYVYQYATGISAATALSKQVLTEGKPAVKRYLDFLGSGCSDFSLNLLNKTGVDLTRPEPIQQAIDLFASYVDEFEKLTEKS